MAQQPVTFTTPQGVAQYPWLSKPDTKFSEEGDYKVNLIIAKEEALPALKLINQVYAENYEKEVKNTQNYKKYIISVGSLLFSRPAAKSAKFREFNRSTSIRDLNNEIGYEAYSYFRQ